MKSSSSTDFTASDGRRFAFPVGTAFLVLSGVAYWRGRPSVALGLVALAGALVLAGALFPGRLGPVYRAWMRMALFISRFTTPIFMGLVYFLVLTPSGLIMRILGRNPIVHGEEDGSYWRSTSGRPKADLRRQF